MRRRRRDHGRRRLQEEGAEKRGHVLGGSQSAVSAAGRPEVRRLCASPWLPAARPLPAPAARPSRPGRWGSGFRVGVGRGL
jgi:hypothetical protein